MKKIEKQGEWFFGVMVDPIEGREITKSYDSLKVLLNGYSESFNSGGTISQPRYPLPGEPIFTPDTWIDMNHNLTYVGLGWDVLPGSIYDLNASIISFDMNINVLEIIYYKNLKFIDGTKIHYGDNKTGLGEEDDELISVNLANMGSNIIAMAVIVNSFKGKRFKIGLY